MLLLLVVPDASVLLKWVLPSDDEPDVHKALPSSRCDPG